MRRSPRPARRIAGKSGAFAETDAESLRRNSAVRHTTFASNPARARRDRDRRIRGDDAHGQTIGEQIAVRIQDRTTATLLMDNLLAVSLGQSTEFLVLEDVQIKETKPSAMNTDANAPITINALPFCGARIIALPGSLVRAARLRWELGRQRGVRHLHVHSCPGS